MNNFDFFNLKCIISVNTLFTTIMQKDIHAILAEFWLTKNQSDIFIYLYTYGQSPASQVAKAIGWERTNVYKAIKKMAHKWIVSEITKKGIKYFFIADKKIFSRAFSEEKKQLEKKEAFLGQLEKELEELEKESYDRKPGIVFFDSVSWVEQMYQDMYYNIKESNYKAIKIFASNTLANKSGKWVSLYSSDFFAKLKDDKISTELYLWNGIMMLENIVKSYDSDILPTLPADNSTIQAFVFGDFVYIAIFRDIPFGIKIQNPEFAQMMHFLLKKVVVGEEI